MPIHPNNAVRWSRCPHELLIAAYTMVYSVLPLSQSGLTYIVESHEIKCVFSNGMRGESRTSVYSLAKMY